MKKLSLMLVLFFATIGTILAQRTVTGKVTDTKGEALIGANVIAKGTTVGAATDLEGTYSIKVPAGATSLVFSYTGYDTQEIALGVSNTVDLALQEGNQLSEVVVTGTGAAIDKRSLGIEVQALTAKQLPNAPSSSIDQALVGKIAGAQISSVNGTPGARVSIILRGINSINRGTNPMIMIDGVEMVNTELQTVDLNIIDHVEVVQGAAGGSIYGAQGANGVIQLFTKKGKSGKINVDFATSYSNNAYLNNGGLKKANMHGFVTDANNNVTTGDGKFILGVDEETGSYLKNLSFASTAPTTFINKPYDKNLPYYDHFKMFLQDAATINNSLSVSGGSDKFDFLISGSNNQQASNFKGNGDYSRSNLTSNLGFEIAKGLKFRSISQLGYTNSTINDGGGRSTIYALFNSRPFANYEAKLPDGSYPAYLGDATGVNGLNPFYINQNSTTSEKRVDILQSFDLNYQPTKWLELDSKLGINYRTDNNLYTYKNQTKNPNVAYWENWWYNLNDGAPTGETNNYQQKNLSKNSVTSATFKFDFQDDFHVKVPLRSTTYFAFDYRSNNQNQYRTVGIGVPDYTPYTQQQTGTQQITRDLTTPFLTYGYVVNQRLDYKDIAGVSAGFRSDYSSAFGQGSKPFTFPSASGYLRVSNFDFWKSGALGRILPEVKLHAASGSAGIQPKQFDRYVTLNTRSLDGNAFFLPTNQPNPALNVEVSKETEVGADFAITPFKGKWFSSFILSPTYWTRTTSNAIWDVDVAPSTGLNSLKDNSFSLGSKGLQVELTTQIASTRNFDWNFKVNYTKSSSEITAIKGAPVVLTSAAGSTGYVLEQGTKIGQIFGYLGLHSVSDVDAAGVPYIAAADQSKYTVASNGWVVNKTSKAPYFTSKQYSFGDPNPKFAFSFINGFTFKKMVSLDFQIDWVQGAYRYNQTKEWMYRDGIHSDYQVPITIEDEKGVKNTEAYSAFYRGVYAERARNGTKSYFYEDASFVRLRNLSVAINLDQIVKIKGLRKCQVVFSGRNLWTKTKYTGLDPESNSSNVYSDGGLGNSAWDRGTDHNTMPNLRSYQVGLKIGL